MYPLGNLADPKNHGPQIRTIRARNGQNTGTTTDKYGGPGVHHTLGSDHHLSVNLAGPCGAATNIIRVLPPHDNILTLILRVLISHGVPYPLWSDEFGRSVTIGADERVFLPCSDLPQLFHNQDHDSETVEGRPVEA